MKAENPKYNIWTIGCQMNMADSRHLSSCLEGFGYEQTERGEDADLIVLNTCVVRDSAQNRVKGKLQYLQGLKSQRPGLKIVLMGCFVGRGSNDELRGEYPFVDIFMPPSDISPLSNYLDQLGAGATPEPGELEQSESDFFILPQTEQNSVSANVPAVLGCSHACTYCIIPYRRGREHSRPRDEVLAECRKLADQGVVEIVLLGQIVDRYGVDMYEDYGLAELLLDTAAIAGVERVRFLTSHPAYFSENILDAVADDKRICPHFEIPCQSGSDAVLQRMRRGYTRDYYRELIARIRDRIPDAAINTDIIVGFPGETEAQFLESRSLLEELKFDTVHLAKYSPRPKTYAQRRFEDDVPSEEKERRWRELDQLQRAIQTERNGNLLGAEVEVLVEERDTRHKRWRGRTPQNKLVFVEDDSNLQAQIVTARIKWAGPFSLIADLIGKRQGAHHAMEPLN